MKIRLVSVENGIDNVGFRKMSAFIRQLNPDTDTYYAATGNYYGLLRWITMIDTVRQDETDIREIAAELAQSDLVGLSSMTQYSGIVKAIIKEIRRINPGVFILWGGIHPIIQPEDAIQYADGVCTGEGEFAFEQFYDAFKAGRDFYSTPGFWFNTHNGVAKNKNLPLMTPQDMDELPPLTYGDGEFIHKQGKGFVPIQARDFVTYNGLSYNTVWSIGCPLKCTYCGNTKFIEYDTGYRRVRHPSVGYMTAEIKRAMKKNPHISTVCFHDDSFMAIPYLVLEDFALRFKEEIGLPFVVFGVIPNYVRDDKIEVLLEGGMNRVRMGIQSGSQKILDFYQRPTPVKRIREAAEILSRYSDYMIPPAYDIILDNPVENRDDTLATLNLLYEMARPFTVNIYSLRIIPNTNLERDIKALGLNVTSIHSSYLAHIPSFGNILIYALLLWKMPQRWYEYLRKFVKPAHEPQPHFRVLMLFMRTLYLSKRSFSHLRFMDFTTITGFPGYVLWKLRIVQFWNKNFVKHYRRLDTTKLQITDAAE